MKSVYIFFAFLASSLVACSPSYCECAEALTNQMMGEDYSHSVANKCLDIYKEEVVEGYKDLPCSDAIVRLYLTNNWTMYFNDLCEGDLCN